MKKYYLYFCILLCMYFTSCKSQIVDNNSCDLALSNMKENQPYIHLDSGDAPYSFYNITGVVKLTNNYKIDLNQINMAIPVNRIKYNDTCYYNIKRIQIDIDQTDSPVVNSTPIPLSVLNMPRTMFNSVQLIEIELIDIENTEDPGRPKGKTVVHKAYLPEKK